MKQFRGLLASALLIFVSGSAHAVVITVDADPFADGTVLNNSFAGITLSAFGSSTDGNVYARTSGLATTGTRVFGNSSGFDPLWIPGGRSLRMDIAAGTDFVSIDIIANDSSDAGTLEIFNSSDVSLGSVTTAVLNNSSETLSFNMAGIAYMVATGNGGNNVALDNIRYNAVPEPVTLGLMGLGLLGLGFARRKSAS